MINLKYGYELFQPIGFPIASKAVK